MQNKSESFNTEHYINGYVVAVMVQAVIQTHKSINE